MIAEKIQADIDATELPADVNPRVLSRYVMAVWEGVAQLERDGASRMDILDVARTALRAWPTTLGSYG